MPGDMVFPVPVCEKYHKYDGKRLHLEYTKDAH